MAALDLDWMGGYTVQAVTVGTQLGANFLGVD